MNKDEYYKCNAKEKIEISFNDNQSPEGIKYFNLELSNLTVFAFRPTDRDREIDEFSLDQKISECAQDKGEEAGTTQGLCLHFCPELMSAIFQ